MYHIKDIVSIKVTPVWYLSKNHKSTNCIDWKIFLNVINNLINNTSDIKLTEASGTGWTGKYVLANCHLHPLDNGKSKRVTEKTSISVLLTMPKILIVWITINCRKFWKRWETRPSDLPLEKFVCRSGSNSYNWTWNNRLVPNRKRSTSRLYIVTLLI